MDRARAMALARVERFTGRSLVGFAALAGLATGFGVLLLLVRLSWDPLYQVDHGIAADANQLVSPRPWLVNTLQVITSLGGRQITVWLVLIVIIALWIRRRRRLSAYLVVTGIGAWMLDPSLKLLVGRLRPVVEVPVAAAPGNSFPSGHALGATVAYGSLLLVLLPAVPRRYRAAAIAATATLVVLIGLTRIGLGVHFASDVLAGWLLGVAWLGITGHAFRLWRQEAGRPAVPLSEGIEPEAAPDLAPAPRERRLLPHPFARTAELVTGWVLVFGLLFVLGSLLERFGLPGDVAVPRWFAEHRTPALDGMSWWLSKAGDTHAVLAVSLVFCPLAVAAIRRWRPVLFLVLVMIGELTLFLTASRAVGRPRPEVTQLDGTLPTSSFPSGHVAATLCLYLAITVVVLPRTDRWWRWIPVAALVVMPTVVAVSRLYRGMHQPSDLLGALLLTVLWVGIVYWVVRPDEDVARSRSEESRGHGAAGASGRPLASAGSRSTYPA